MSNIQDLVELTIFHSLRQECIDRGYLPDIMAFPNTFQGAADYDMALKAISAGPLGFCVEVFNNANPQFQGYKKPPRIVMESENFLPGTTGLESTEQYEDIGGEYQGYVLSNLMVDFTIRVHLVAETSNQLRTLTSILSRAIPTRGYKAIFLSEYPEEGVQEFFMQNIGYADIPSSAEDLIEKVYRYEIPDLMNAELVNYTAKYSKLVQITLDTLINTSLATSIILGEQPPIILPPPIDYSVLYNWFVVGYNPGGASVAPVGSRVLTNADWVKVQNTLGGLLISGANMKEVGYLRWLLHTNTNTTNSSGLTAIGSGARSSLGAYLGLKTTFAVWTPDDENMNENYALMFYATYAGDNSWLTSQEKKAGGAIRCIKNSTNLIAGQTGTITDYDGNVYPTICIGAPGEEQEIMVENLRVTHFNDGTIIPVVPDATDWANLTTPGMCAWGNNWENVFTS